MPLPKGPVTPVLPGGRTRSVSQGCQRQEIDSISKPEQVADCARSDRNLCRGQRREGGGQATRALPAQGEVC